MKSPRLLLALLLVLSPLACDDAAPARDNANITTQHTPTPLADHAPHDLRVLSDGTLQLLERHTTTGRFVARHLDATGAELALTSEPATTAAFAPDGHILTTPNAATLQRLSPTLTPRNTFSNLDLGITPLALTGLPDETTIVGGVSADRTGFDLVWLSPEGEPTQRLRLTELSPGQSAQALFLQSLASTVFAASDEIPGPNRLFAQIGTTPLWAASPLPTTWEMGQVTPELVDLLVFPDGSTALVAEGSWITDGVREIRAYGAMRFDPDGELLHQFFFETDTPSHFAPRADGGILAVTTRDEDVRVLDYDPEGLLERDLRLGFDAPERGLLIAETPNGAPLILAERDGDLWLFSLDP